MMNRRIKRVLDYVKRFSMSKQGVALFAGSILGIFPQVNPCFATAVDRYGFLGNTFSFPMQFEPVKEAKNEAFAIELGTFFSERWAGILAFDFAVKDSDRIALAIGPRVYLALDLRLKPYVGGRFMYLVNTTNDIGGRIQFGLEYDLERLTRMNNLRFTAETGVTGFVQKDIADEMYWDMIRLGFAWNY